MKTWKISFFSLKLRTKITIHPALLAPAGLQCTQTKTTHALKMTKNADQLPKSLTFQPHTSL